MPKWEFSMHYIGSGKPRWTWSLWTDDGTVMSRSTASFGTLEDCVADADRSGFPGRQEAQDPAG